MKHRNECLVEIPIGGAFYATEHLTWIPDGADSEGHDLKTMYGVYHLQTDLDTAVEAYKHAASTLSPPHSALAAYVNSRQNCVGHAFSLDYWIQIEQVHVLLAGEGYRRTPEKPAGEHMVLYYDEADGVPRHISRYDAQAGVYSHKQGVWPAETLTTETASALLAQYPYFEFYEKQQSSAGNGRSSIRHLLASTGKSRRN